MEKKPTYEDIRHELDTAIQRANALPAEKDRINFVADASLKLHEQFQAGLLSEPEYNELSRKLSLFAKEAFSAEDLAHDLWMDGWERHREERS